MRAGTTNTFSVIDKVEHRRKRRVVGQAFTDRALVEIEPTLIRHVDTFVRTLTTGDGPLRDSKGWGPPVNVALQSKFLAIDVIGMFAFGKSLDLLTNPANRFIRDVLTAPAFMMGIYFQCPRLNKLRLEQFGLEKPLMWWHGENMSYDRPKFGRLMMSMVQERLALDKHANKDLFSLLIDAKDPDTGEGLAVEELWAEARVFMVAGMLSSIDGDSTLEINAHHPGSDTTAASLAATFFHLSRNPATLQRLTQVVRGAFASGSDIRSGVMMRDLAYLRACIDEALRLNPAVPIALWREVAAPEGISIDGAFVPNGTEIGASLYTIHHDPVIFPDPFRYEPERWMGEPGPALDRMHKAFNPFSLGTRRCVAQNLAYLELQLAVAKTVWYLDARRPEGPLDAVGGGVRGRTDGRDRVEEYQLEEHFTVRHDGPYLEFRCREGFDKEVAALGI